jgi:glycosyltransferase involved in cell wall biosynthesis
MGSRTKAAAPQNDLLASVVVPARNAGIDLQNLLEALAQQTIPRERFEILIGDDGSTDGSTSNLTTEDGWVRIARGSQKSSDAARNRAARLARSEVLAFCDADCLPQPEWLEEGITALVDADLAGGPIRGRWSEQPTLWTLLDLDTFTDQERAIKSGFAVTGNLFVRREIFERVDGFDDELHYWGDFDFAQRCVEAGARLVLAPNAVASHPTYNAAWPFLRKVWAVNHAYARHQTRIGERPSKLRLREWVPLAQPLRSRLKSGRSLGLDDRRLRSSGVRPRPRDHVRAMPVMYVVMPYLSAVAQLSGWWHERKTSVRSAEATEAGVDVLS